MRVRTLLLPSLILLPIAGCASTGSNAGTAKSGDSGGATPTANEATGITDAAFPSANGASGAAGQGTQDFVERAQVQQQRADVLVADYLAQGAAAYDRAELSDALVFYSRALDLDPSNDAAAEGVRRVRATMGDDLLSAGDLMQDGVDIEIVRRQLARIEAEDAILDGDNHQRLGRHTEAIRAYERARMILTVQPLVQDTDLDLEIVQRRIDMATSAQDDAVLRREQDSRLAAERDRELAEQEQQQARARKLSTWYSKSHDAFLNDDYESAQQYAEMILVSDPGNQAAAEMKEIARAAALNKADDELQREYRQQWIRTMEDLEQSDVPQTEALTYELERWADVDERKPYGFTTAGIEMDPERERVERILRAERVPATFGDGEEGAPLAAVAVFLSQNTGVNFLLSTALKDLDEEETAVNISLGEKSVYEVLQLIAATSETVRWTIQNGTVMFVSAEEQVGNFGLQTYEVRDLIRAPQDFVAPEINVLPSEGIEYAEDELPEIEATVLTGDELVGLIEENISPDAWEGASIQLTETGALVVYQTPEVHAQIDALLNDLRELAGIMVDIQTRFLRVEDSFLEEIGVDFRGLGSPGLGTGVVFDDYGPTGTTAQGLNESIGTTSEAGVFFDAGGGESAQARVENLFDSSIGSEQVSADNFSNDGVAGKDFTNSGGLSGSWTYLGDMQLELLLRAVSKAQRVELVTAPRLLVYNGARANLQVLNQYAYVQDYNVEIATAAAIADPIIQVIQDGVILDVRPVVSADRRFITLDIRPTVATLQQPIATFVTTLNVATSVLIQLPELEIERLRTVVSVPDGGTLLLGGLRLHSDKRDEAGVPILRNIPIVNLFFERKAQFKENLKTLMLMTSEVVIPREVTPSPAMLGRDE
jgi:Flp pilus assembly secretin CpaC/tetratricopeptide (TPR) repeat protein